MAGVSAQGAAPDKLTGSIVGWVTNSAGIPQMGAAVLLFDRSERVTGRALTDEAGSFLFGTLVPGSYSVRVSLASFLPALKKSIVVQPGMRSLLNVNLASVLSSIELVYSAAGSGSVMNDDWRWVLRSSNATRPVLRFLPRFDVPEPASRRSSALTPFSETRVMVRISAGEEGRVSQYGNEPGLGTAFALATSLFGDNQLQFSGNFGYSANSGIPATGFRTSYSRGSRGERSSPQVNLTMRQLYLPARAGTGLVTGQEGAAPALRTMSAGFLDRSDISEALRFEYGFSLEFVSFLNTLSYFSPYGRLTYDLGDGEVAEFAFSSGVPPTELFAAAREAGNELQQDLAALALFPRVSLKDGRARVQRAENFEVAYRKTVGSRTYGVAAYSESVRNAALTMVAPAGAVPPGDLLPDLLSNSAVFNVGDYSSAGYMASVTEALGGHLNLTVAGGSGNALIPSGRDLRGESSDDLRLMLRHGQRRWAAARLSATLPGAGTYFMTSYRWADGRSLTAGHMYLTQTLRPDVGWNMYLRQPVPAFPGMRGRLEAIADLRNLLAQGYFSFSTPEGRRILLLHTPRSLRGGLSFIF
jgi:hypothetical protein